MIQVVRMLDPGWWEGTDLRHAPISCFASSFSFSLSSGHSAAGYGVFPGTYCEAVVPGRELKPILLPDQLAEPMAAVQVSIMPPILLFAD
jgi:hypothetical protein